MDGSSGKRARGGPVIPRKGTGVQFKETSDNGDMNAQFCNRLGCHGRINHTKVISNRQTSKLSSGKATVGSSTRTSSSMATISKLPLKSTRKETSPVLKTDTFEASGSSSKIRMMEVGCSSSSSSSSSSSRVNKGIQENSPGLSVLPLISKNSSSCNARRFSLRSGRCNSTQDVVPSGTTSTTNLNRKKDVMKKQIPVVETKASGKKVSGPTTTIERGRVSDPSNGISISDSRRTRTQRLTNINNRPYVLPHPTSWEVPMPEPSFVGNSYARTSQRLLGESSSRVSNFNPVSDGSSSSSTGRSSPSLGREGIRRYNMDGFAEVLWALENFDQDEGITREQLLAMEAQFFLGGMSFYDQHRDMRLDIDNMSYEELLALEEKMGNVSTAIAEEHVLKHLRKSIYQRTSVDTMGCGGDHDDIKCSICQEEYMIGEEVGGLDCNHVYHLDCIHQWLQVKKWCPICKAEAAPTGCSSSL
ncbi:probable E3 ubiquitin-protein ligase HIP1 [Impatiens glandulifera]|uniref:probable E3 ubiquitin-protein ligase HIP1 n=1 Tax=Impatiens glandulifera TaxID=253017 RepID=UPI001FB0AACE|nr:probable E3 ubiquitin-protein ligase HIP1 [Impatiens glandulifera]